MKARARIEVALLLALLGGTVRGQIAQAPSAASGPADHVFDALDTQPLLMQLNFTLVPPSGSVALAILPPFPKGEGHVEELENVLGSFARALVELFRTDYSGPAGLEPAADRETLLVVTIDQPDLFNRLRSAAAVHDARDEQAFFMPSLPGVVVLDPGPAEGLPGVLALVRPLCHAAVHALLGAWAPPDRQLPLWLEEGLAERLSANNGRLPAKRESLRTFDEEALAMVASADSDPLVRAATKRSLSDVVAVVTPADLTAQTQAADVPPRTALRGLGCDADLFLIWLDQGKLGHLTNEELKEVWKGRRLVQAVLGGQSCADALTAILGPGAPAAQQEAFAQWLQERIDEHGSSPPPVRAQPEKASEDAAAPGAPVVEATPASVAALAAARLAVPTDDAAIQHARALQRASDGDMHGALAALDELLGRPDLPAGLADSLLIERRVGKQLEDLRRRWAAEHAGKSVELRDGESTLRATLVSVQGDTLAVKDGSRPRELPLDALLPGTLAAQLFAPDTQLTPADDEARALAWLLAADGSWKDHTLARSRKESAAGGAALLERRPAFDTSLHLGRVVAALDALSASEAPAAGHTQAERDAWLERATVVLQARDLPVVADRLAPLRTLLQQVLEAAFDDAPLEHLELHGKVEALDGGRVHARWDFSDAGQLRDWSAVTLREADTGRMPPLKSPSPGPASLAVEGRQLVLRGRGQWRCALPFVAPMAVTYELQYRKTPDEVAGTDTPEEKSSNVVLRLCADVFGNYLECEGLGRLSLYDLTSSTMHVAEPTVGGWLTDTWYRIHLEHDGQKLRAEVDGVPVATTIVASRKHGFVELMHNTDRPIALRLLEVEGAPDLEALAPQRDAWVGKRLAELGAGP
ncbi:MAG TPA: hypothetical protein VFY71_01525 [Planctomycetota bacterium]|nr:hypothetical protein [Planctomycetota bacterium]